MTDLLIAPAIPLYGWLARVSALLHFQNARGPVEFERQYFQRTKFRGALGTFINIQRTDRLFLYRIIISFIYLLACARGCVEACMLCWTIASGIPEFPNFSAREFHEGPEWK